MKHRHWLLTLGIIILISIIQQAMRIEFQPQQDSHLHHHSNNFLDQLEIITGTLLT